MAGSTSPTHRGWASRSIPGSSASSWSTSGPSRCEFHALFSLTTTNEETDTMTSRRLIALAAASLAALLALPASAQEQVSLRVAYVQAPDHPHGLGIQKF